MLYNNILEYYHICYCNVALRDWFCQHNFVGKKTPIKYKTRKGVGPPENGHLFLSFFLFYRIKFCKKIHDFHFTALSGKMPKISFRCHCITVFDNFMQNYRTGTFRRKNAFLAEHCFKKCIFCRTLFQKCIFQRTLFQKVSVLCYFREKVNRFVLLQRKS